MPVRLISIGSRAGDVSAGNGNIDAGGLLRYIHMSESNRGTPGEGTRGWDEIHATLAAIGFRGGVAMELGAHRSMVTAGGIDQRYRPQAELGNPPEWKEFRAS